jgi:hypothetical protein
VALAYVAWKISIKIRMTATIAASTLAIIRTTDSRVSSFPSAEGVGAEDLRKPCELALPARTFLVLRNLMELRLWAFNLRVHLEGFFTPELQFFRTIVSAELG